MKKGLVFILTILILLNSLLVSAINLDINKTTVNNVIVSELNNPATFNLKIRNLGETDNFQIYSLVGVDMTPKGTFQIGSFETKDIEVKVYALDKLRSRPGVLTFVYKIYGQSTGIQEDSLTINIMEMQDALEVGSLNINPASQYATIYMANKVNEPFDIKAEFSSAFFDVEKEFAIKPMEMKYFNITIEKEKMKTLLAGSYILTANLKLEDKSYKVTGPIKFVEQEGISTTDSSSGILFRTRTIEKVNVGNVLITATVNIRKNIISRLFTTFNIEPTEVARKGIFVYYLFEKEIQPSETFVVRTTTSWIYPLLLLILVLIIAYLSFLYTKTELILKKRIAFVKTKGGEFALKVYLTAKAREFVEKIEITDKIPGIAKIYERFPGITPDKVDNARRRISWNIESLHPGEERVFNYIIYSKVGVVGKFELPPATAVYEKEGKIKESFSNKTFFMNEPASKEYKGE